MSHFLKRRHLGWLAAVFASQWLSACVIVPLPYARHRATVIDVQPGYGHPAPRDERDRRGRDWR